MSADARPLAIVTGAGRGIGRAIALGLAQAGYDLALVGRSDLVALEDAAETASALGATCSARLCDVSDERQTTGLFEAISPQLSRLAALVNNAAVIGERAVLDELAMSAIDEIIAVNLR